MLTIRPFEATDADYQAVIAINQANWPEYPSTIEILKHEDRTREAKYLYEREMIEKEGKIVGWASYSQWAWSFHPDKYAVNINLTPDFQNQGIGSVVLVHLQRLLAKRNPIAIMISTREDKSHSLRFLAKHGFEQIMRYARSILDVTAFNDTQFVQIVEKVEHSGIRIVSLRELAEIDPNWKHKLYELEWEIGRDVPHPEPSQKRSFDNFEQQILANPRLLLDGWFVALDGECYVGLTNLWMRVGTKEFFETGLTGVVRSHRQRGIATGLKCRAIAFAKVYGAKKLETDNEENNPMYLLNMKLGFKSAPAWLEFEKRLKKD